MKDFTVEPEWTGMGGWQTAIVHINTKRAAEAYNEYFDTERQKGDAFTITSKSFKEFETMREINGLSILFG